MLQVKDKDQLGYLGTAYALLELAKRNMRGLITPDFDFDILCNNGVRLEVKTSRLHNRVDSKRAQWQFTNSRRRWIWAKGAKYNVRTEPISRHCDFYVLIGLNKELEQPRFFIISKETMEKAGQVIQLHPDYPHRGKWEDFYKNEDKWDLITKGW